MKNLFLSLVIIALMPIGLLGCKKENVSSQNVTNAIEYEKQNINEPIENCDYEGEEASCKRIIVSIKNDYTKDKEQLIDKIKQLFTQYDAVIFYEYHSFNGWAVAVDSHEKQLELMNNLKELEGVSAAPDLILKLNN